eukprot:541461_1
MTTLLLVDELINTYATCKEDQIPIGMNIFEYSTLLYNIFTTNKYPFQPNEKLMNLCVDISLWITSPNESIHEYEFTKYFQTLNKYFYENVSHIIIAFIFDPSKYLKWIQFKNIPLKLIKNMDIDEFIAFIVNEIYLEIGHSFDPIIVTNELLSNDVSFESFRKLVNPEQFSLLCTSIQSDIMQGVFFQIKAKILMEIQTEKAEKSKYEKWQNQLTFSEHDSIVDFSHSRYDIINIRTDLLANDTKYFINIYCFEKGDELWLGLVTKNAYEPSTYYRKYKHGLFYYGGRKRKINTFGGAMNDTCSEQAYTHAADDCNHGSIQGSDMVLKHPLDSYGCGDWINFMIDMKNKNMVVYKNGMKQYEMENKKFFPDGECYFILEVDARNDKFYIEQTVNDSAFT